MHSKKLIGFPHMLTIVILCTQWKKNTQNFIFLNKLAIESIKGLSCEIVYAFVS